MLNIIHAIGGATLTPEVARSRIRALKGKVLMIKVHPATIIRMQRVYGFDIIQEIKDAGLGVMLDDKAHDIRVEVAEFVQSYEAAGADILTVHASGGPLMLEKAVQAASKIKIFGVTLLTSIEDWEVSEIYNTGPQETMLRLMRQVEKAQCHGSVCAPRDLEWVRGTGIDLKNRLRLCPGVRDPKKPIKDDDQNTKRTLTPYEAGRERIDLIVIGRQIADSPDPSGEAEEIQAQFLAGREAA